MPGAVIFNPDDPLEGLATTDEQAVGVFLDIEDDKLYFTDTVNIYEWEGNTGTNQEFTWRSGKIRLARLVNLGAAIVEADSYASITFKLYADGVLVAQVGVSDGEPFRLPDGYLSNIYEIEIISTDVVTKVSAAENIFELAEG